VTQPLPSVGQKITISNPDGSTTEVVVNWDPPPPPVPMLIGNASGKPDLTRYPGTAACTLFNQPGKGLNVAAYQAVPAGVYPIVCVKDVDLDPATVKAVLSPWLDVVDAPCALVPHHEPKPDETAALYVQRANVAYDIIDAHPNGKLVDKGCKFGGWNQADDFVDWLTGRETWVGWDIYSQSLLAYPDPVKFIAAAVASSAYAKKPAALTEFMALRITSDTTGAARAAWISQVIAAAGEAEFRFAMPWDGIGIKSVKYPNGIPFGPFPLNSPEYGAMLALTTTQGGQ